MVAATGSSVATTWTGLSSGDRGDARQLLAFEELERGPPTRGDPRHVVFEPELGDRPDRVAAADDGVSVDRGDRLCDGPRARRERIPLEDAHRPVPEHRRRTS